METEIISYIDQSVCKRLLTHLVIIIYMYNEPVCKQDVVMCLADLL